MNTPNDDLARIHALAHCRADALRREAMADFWRGADAVLAATAGSARRSAQRLAYRLARHVRGRKASAPCTSSAPARPAGV